MAKRPLTCLDLFSGCGGMTHGLHQVLEGSGQIFKCIGAIDHWPPACQTFATNFGIKPVVGTVSPETVARALGGRSVDLVVGGPPCQGFSTSGKRAVDDPRNKLAFTFIDIVTRLRPRAFIMENVSGFVTFQSGNLFQELVQRAVANGYQLSAGVLCASLHGVPQRRRRFFLVGALAPGFKLTGDPMSPVDEGLFESRPRLDIDEYPDQDREQVSFDDATSDLPLIAAGSSAYLCRPRNAFQRYCRAARSPVLTEHVAPRHSKDFVRMMSYVPQGRSAMDPEIASRIPASLRPTSGFPNSYARIKGAEPAPTITRNFTTPSSANCIHPRADRALSLREGARCQSFPDDFEFCGSGTDKRLMIGNAVPPLLARHLETLLAAHLGRAVTPVVARVGNQRDGHPGVGCAAANR